MNIDIELSERNIESIAKRVALLLIEERSEKPQEKGEHTYTAEQVALITNTTPSTITRYLRLGLIVGKKAGKSWLVTQDNLNTYIGK